MPAAQTDTPAPTDAPAQTGMPAAQSITADDTEADDRAYDKQCFDARAVTTLDDRRIVGYFRPELVDRDKVLRELDAGNAAQQAFGIDAHAAYGKARTDIRDIKKRQAETLRSGALNLRTTIIFLGFGTIVVFFLNQLSQARQNSLIGCLLVLVIPGLACIAAFLPTRGIRERSRRPQMISLGVLALVFTVACIVFSHFAFRHPPNLIVMSVAGAVGILAGLLLASRKTSAECRALIKAAREELGSSKRDKNLEKLLKEWLAACTEEVIMPQVVLIINTLLGKIADELLVEQNSEGLRKLLDPSYTVSTRSEERVRSVLSQMDGGSIALAGPRGAGKSTLLRKVRASRNAEEPTISVYVSAPAEYVPRDFIAEVFQGLCQVYLRHQLGYVPDVIHAKRRSTSLRRGARRLLGLCWLLFRALAALALVAWIAWPFLKTHYPHERHSFLAWWDPQWHKIAVFFRNAWTRYNVPLKIAIVLFALLFFPKRGPWRQWQRRWTRRPERLPLVNRAQEYLARLQVDKTITQGVSLNSPSARGLGVNFQRGSSVKYVPWTLPELIRYVRIFMRDIAEEFKQSSQAVLVCIDEIDRIGSLEHAERFISEIKAIFGIERCFFLVAVAEDVGSVFAQRATSGRSLLENAFDNIVAVEPLSLNETRNLLLKRVPGFTDSFVYLVHALSGGLPRELIRISRRLVEVNLELQRPGYYPLLSELSLVLVKEELVEAMRASRNQLSQLALSSAWTQYFDLLRAASTSLRRKPSIPRDEAHQIIEELSALTAPADSGRGDSQVTTAQIDEGKARRIIDDFAAYAYFGLTIIDAFDNNNFSLAAVTARTAAGLPGSYEELALARAELSVSTASSKSMLQRFRATLTTQPVN